MEISLRLDTLGIVELRYLRGRERYREWPPFQLLAASRQARVIAYFNHDVAEQLHQQILIVEEAVGLAAEDEDEEEEDEEERALNGDEGEGEEGEKSPERESSAFSPAFAQALKQLNELARQRLPDGSGSGSQSTGELTAETETESDEEDALEQLQDAFAQMMEVVRELAEEMSTDALKLTGRFKCVRTEIEFVPRVTDEDEDHEMDEEILGMEVELVMVLKLFEEGRARADDPPAVELQLDVDDFERLHETLDIALERERRSRRRRQ
ncbi:MAG TPA: hypothetical protein VKV37_08975 [Ktedonobacteraceae bacterium]|jgi:hypothetical protein|nr:hypothetical protein [Ktedonobacteraceae bacterium]